MLTIHLLVQNHEKTIAQTLESIAPLDGKIVVCDIGSRDKTMEICKKHKVEIIKKHDDNRSRIRNEIIERTDTIWQLYIEPWEILLDGHETIKTIVDKNDCENYHCKLMQDDIITKQIRLWRKDTKVLFTNPVMETLKDNQSTFADLTFWQNAHETDSSLLEKWKKTDPLSTEVDYFIACHALSKKDYDAFINICKKYLFHHKTPTVQSVMIHYYLAIVYSNIKIDFDSAMKHILICLSEHPLMAEFWCCLGDLYCQLKEFSKAIAFYENGLILGSRRYNSDKWPIHINKYDDYPKTMIAKCKEIEANTRKLI